MTSFASLFNLPMLVIGTAGLILLVILSGRRRETRGQYFWAGSGLIVVLMFVGWAILSTVLRVLTYSGGTIEEIYFREAIVDVVAYAVIFCIMLVIEKYRGVTKVSGP